MLRQTTTRAPVDRRQIVAYSTVFSIVVIRLLYQGGSGYDLHPIWLAAHDFVQQKSPYGGASLIDCIPSAVLLMAPLGWLGESSVQLVAHVVAPFLVIAAVSLALSAAAIKVTSRTGIGILLLAATGQPIIALVDLRNIGLLAVPLAVVATVRLARKAWLPAAILLGLSLAIKPVAILVLLIFLWRRQWSAALVSVSIPVVLSTIALLLNPQTADFFSLGIPRLLNGYRYLDPVNASLAGLGHNFGLPQAVIIPLRLAVVIAGVTSAHGLVDRDDKVIEAAGLLVITTGLTATFGWNHYVLFALPMLIRVTQRGSHFHTVPCAIAAILLLEPLRIVDPARAWFPTDTAALTCALLTFVVTAAWRHADGKVHGLVPTVTRAPS